MPQFCTACKRVLTRNTSSGYAVFHCKCGASYPADPEDSMIKSSFVNKDGVDVRTIL